MYRACFGVLKVCVRLGSLPCSLSRWLLVTHDLKRFTAVQTSLGLLVSARPYLPMYFIVRESAGGYLHRDARIDTKRRLLGGHTRPRSRARPRQSWRGDAQQCKFVFSDVNHCRQDLMCVCLARERLHLADVSSAAGIVSSHNYTAQPIHHRYLTVGPL